VTDKLGSMDTNEAKTLLSAASFSIKSEKRLANDTGVQLRLTNGGIVNVFDKGTFNVQGTNSGDVEKALGMTLAGAAPAASRPTRVFVVYGHDQAARTQLEAMLRRWGLDPLILDQLPSEGQTIIEKLVAYTSGAEFAVVLSTPDDEGHRAGHATEKAFRARQNVVLELGMLLQKLGRKKVAILLKEQDKMERPSDIQGLIYIPFRDNLEKEAGVLLAKEMCAQGYDIAVAKL
jgi:predicted nucleotide-binding protein